MRFMSWVGSTSGIGLSRLRDLEFDNAVQTGKHLNQCIKAEIGRLSIQQIWPLVTILCRSALVSQNRHVLNMDVLTLLS